MRPIIALVAGVAVIAAISAGPLAAASDGLDVPVDDIAGREIAKLLLVETLEEEHERWDPRRLRTFVDDLGVDRAGELDVEVVEDATGPALAVTVRALGGDAEQVCVVADADGVPVSAGRPCR